MKHLLVIGQGPAGISAAVYAKRGGAAVTVVANGVGALEKAEQIENYYGFGEPLTGRELAAQGVEGAKRLGVDFVEGELVGLRFKDTMDGFVAELVHRTLEADAVVLAMGASRLAPPLSGLKELEGHGVSYCAICDAFFYRGKEAAVLGAGDYALASRAMAGSSASSSRAVRRFPSAAYSSPSARRAARRLPRSSASFSTVYI